MLELPSAPGDQGLVPPLRPLLLLRLLGVRVRVIGLGLGIGLGFGLGLGLGVGLGLGLECCCCACCCSHCPARPASTIPAMPPMPPMPMPMPMPMLLSLMQELNEYLELPKTVALVGVARAIHQKYLAAPAGTPGTGRAAPIGVDKEVLATIDIQPTTLTSHLASPLTSHLSPLTARLPSQRTS